MRLSEWYMHMQKNAIYSDCNYKVNKKYGTLTKLTVHQRSGRVSVTTALSHQTYHCLDKFKK